MNKPVEHLGVFALQRKPQTQECELVFCLGSSYCFNLLALSGIVIYVYML